MPRNGYTSEIHERVRAQIALQEEEMARLERSLSRNDSDVSPLRAIGEEKELRRIRRKQERRHKPERFRGTNRP